MSASLNRKYKEIGSRIASLRILAGITREEFCRKYKVNEYTLQAWELGRNKMRRQAAEKLCQALNVEKNIVCTTDWIYFGKGLSPYSKTENHSGEKQKTTSVTIENDLDQEMILQCEIDFFQRLHIVNKPTVLKITDQAMTPLYNPEEYVGAIAISGEFVNAFHGEICMIEMTSGIHLVRRFLKSEENFILVPLNTQEKVITVPSIKSISEIIWHRRHPKNFRT